MSYFWRDSAKPNAQHSLFDESGHATRTCKNMRLQEQSLDVVWALQFKTATLSAVSDSFCNLWMAWRISKFLPEPSGPLTIKGCSWANQVAKRSMFRSTVAVGTNGGRMEDLCTSSKEISAAVDICWYPTIRDSTTWQCSGWLGSGIFSLAHLKASLVNMARSSSDTLPPKPRQIARRKFCLVKPGPSASPSWLRCPSTLLTIPIRVVSMANSWFPL